MLTFRTPALCRLVFKKGQHLLILARMSCAIDTVRCQHKQNHHRHDRQRSLHHLVLTRNKFRSYVSMRLERNVPCTFLSWRSCNAQTLHGDSCSRAVAARSSLAHHPFGAEYDSRRPAHLHGIVTKVEWTNPHAFLIIDGKAMAIDRNTEGRAG